MHKTDLTMKKKIVLLSIFLVLIASGYVAWQKSIFSVVQKKENIYRNSEYGFEITLPKSWVRYEVSKSFHQDGVTLIYFGLPLEKDLNGSKTYNRWSIEITPRSQWVADRCKSVEGLCTQGEEIGRNEKYVFESNVASPYLGSDCLLDQEFRKTAMYACSVYADVGSFYKEGFRLIR